MATRVYLKSSGSADLTPSTWNFANQINPVTLPATTTKNTGDAMTSKTEATGTTSPTARAMGRWVIGPLAGQTISGNVKGQIRGSESNAGANASPALAIKIIKPDGTDRAVLLAQTAADAASVGHEFVTALTNSKFENAAESASIALTSQVATAGDYLVIEIGFRSATTTTRNIVLSYGNDSATDLPEDTSTTAANNPWIEFSNSISFIFPVTGTLSSTLAALTLAAAGTLAASGSLAATCDAMTLSAAAGAPITASASPTLGGTTLSAGAAAAVSGSLSGTLADLTCASDGTVESGEVSGDLLVTLADIDASADGLVRISGSAAQTLGGIGLTAEATNEIAGALDGALDGATLTAEATSAIVGQAAPTLDAITLAAAATSSVTGTLDATLDALDLQADGAIGAFVTGDLAATLDAFTASAEADAAVNGAAVPTLEPLTLSSAGLGEIDGSVEATLEPLSLSAHGGAWQEWQGALDVTLDAVTLSANAVIVSDEMPAGVIVVDLDENAYAFAVDEVIEARYDFIIEV